MRQVGEDEGEKCRGESLVGTVNRLHSQVEIMSHTYLVQIIKQAKQQNVPVITLFNSLVSCSEFYGAKSRTSD